MRSRHQIILLCSGKTASCRLSKVLFPAMMSSLLKPFWSNSVTFQSLSLKNKLVVGVRLSIFCNIATSHLTQNFFLSLLSSLSPQYRVCVVLTWDRQWAEDMGCSDTCSLFSCLLGLGFGGETGKRQSSSGIQDESDLLSELSLLLWLRLTGRVFPL